MFYDEEAVYQDADILQAQYEQESRAIRARRNAGVCCHQSAVGYVNPPIYPEQEGLLPGQIRCTEGCGTVFDSDQAWYEAMTAAVD